MCAHTTACFQHNVYYVTCVAHQQQYNAHAKLTQHVRLKPIIIYMTTEVAMHNNKS